MLPAFELISTIVHADPGEDGDHSGAPAEPDHRRYLRAARRNDMLLILDIQPGYAPFMREVRALRRWLEEPDVSLALDPEWSMQPPVLPGQEIGSTSASVVNEVSAYLSRIVRERPARELLVVHRFTNDMIENEEALRRHPGVALTVNVDGFGHAPGQALEVPRVHSRPPRPPPRLQALLQRGHEHDAAAGRAVAAAAARAGGLRVTVPSGGHR